MAWPASSGSMAGVFYDMNREAIRIKAMCLASYNQMNTGDVSVNVINQLYSELTSFDKKLAEAQTYGSDMVAYARDQFGDQEMDVAAEFTAMRAAVSDVQTQIESDLPDYNGWLTIVQFDGQGGFNWRQFTKSQTTVLRGKIYDLYETIA